MVTSPGTPFVMVAAYRLAETKHIRHSGNDTGATLAVPTGRASGRRTGPATREIEHPAFSPYPGGIVFRR